MDTKTVIHGSLVAKTTEVTTPTGYHDTWYYNDNGKQEDWKFLAYPVSSDLDLYVNFEANKHRLYFNLADSNYGTTDIGTFLTPEIVAGNLKYDGVERKYYMETEYQQSYGLQPPTDTGGFYDFGYWKRGSSTYTDYYTINDDSDITLDAVYGHYYPIIYGQSNWYRYTNQYEFFARKNFVFDINLNAGSNPVTLENLSTGAQFDDIYFFKCDPNTYRGSVSNCYQPVFNDPNLIKLNLKTGTNSINTTSVWNYDYPGIVLVNRYYIPSECTVNTTGSSTIFTLNGDNVSSFYVPSVWAGKRVDISVANNHSIDYFEFSGPSVINKVKITPSYGSSRQDIRFTGLKQESFLNGEKVVFKANCFSDSSVTNFTIMVPEFITNATELAQYFTFESGFKGNFTGEIEIMTAYHGGATIATY